LVHGGRGFSDTAGLFVGTTGVTLSPIKTLISRAAAADRCARARTSLATTANPRPDSPARAASMAAFSARMLVWKAMPSMVVVMSPMRLDAAWMPSMVATMVPMISPPWRAASALSPASRSAPLAAPAVSLTVAAICAIDAAVCCRLEADCSVRSERS
jgi:hypothetical protein